MWSRITGEGDTIGRGRYAVVGGVLTALKYNLDRFVALANDRYWTPIDYWVPSSLSVRDLSRDDAAFYAQLVAVALPFVAIGVALTVRRLRDAGLPWWPVLLFFVPFVNLLLFLVLCALPSAGEAERPQRRSRLARIVPESRIGSAAAAVIVTAVLGVAFTAFAAEVLQNYGWGLFVGNPFAMGLIAAVTYGYHRPRHLDECVVVALLVSVIAGALLLALAVEGVFCLVMAAPLVVLLATLGAIVGYLVQRRGRIFRAGEVYSVALFLPLLLAGEAALGARPSVLPVTTQVVVAAPPEVVWRHVVEFPELPPPRELYFRSGIAYPIGARIDGRGVGAVRRCRFSTGDFVEPITVWDEPRLLRFAVTGQPPPMRELSPWGDVHPPHLDGFLHSRQGQFRLTPLPGGRTLLTGTTWYENRMWPEPYWRLWSDALIHRIHARVLRHVAALAEADALR